MSKNKATRLDYDLVGRLFQRGFDKKYLDTKNVESEQVVTEKPKYVKGVIKVRRKEVSNERPE